MNEAPQYLAYLVRLWRDTEESGWRVLVKQVGTAEEWHFASMEAFYLFLDRNAHTGSLEVPAPCEPQDWGSDG